MKSIQHGEFAMPLQRGEVQGYDFNRMIVEFTMLNQGKAIACAISTTAMDDLEGRRDVNESGASISFCGCAKSLKSEHRASSSTSRPKPTGPWCSIQRFSQVVARPQAAGYADEAIE